MPVGLLGRKVGMTQIYGADGDLVPVTVIELGPCVVIGLRTRERDGYEAVQLGFADKKRRLATRSERGQVAQISSKRQKRLQAAGQTLVPKAGCEPKRFVREFRTDGEEHGLAVGQTLTVAAFAEIPRVDVIGTIKGRGTTGVMKRHNFQGQGASHGVKRVHRHGGSIGSSADPSRVLKGTRMAGRYGGSRVTMRNLKVVRVDEPSNMLLVAGAVPGPGGSWVVVRRTKKKRKVRAKAK